MTARSGPKSTERRNDWTCRRAAQSATEGWSEARACQLVRRTLDEIAADYPTIGGPFDGTLFQVFDLEVAAAFARRSLEEVGFLCSWYRTELVERALRTIESQTA
ncbi:MAG: hypothetical protein HY903_19405 [Deltaproteobacteria bacterium]|nr:hypothetical protein [Deltaproteobacteria bacterium]